MAHDIPNNEIFRSMILDPTDELLAYGYLLGRVEGIPYIYSDLGKAGGAGLRDDRWAFAHRSPVLAKMIRFRKHVQGTPQTKLFASDCVIVFGRGTQGIVAINKCGEAQDVRLEASSINFQSFRDLITETSFVEASTSQGSQWTLRIPGRSVRLYTNQ
jgi:alpha-amylase